MSKSILFAIIPMLFCVTVKADDDLKSMMAKLDNTQAAATETVDQDKLGQADVDALLGEETKDSEQAVAACFRRFGGGHGSYGYSSYSCYRPSYNYCYSPSYSYCAPSYNTCYSPYVSYSTSYTTCYTPSYSYSSCYSPCYTPCYTSYWGCY